jgi:hypothetical protein
MIKHIILITGILAAAFVRLGGERVSITQNVPVTVNAGSEFQLEVAISKAGISGYGKAQSTLPKGFVAVDDGSKGALLRQDENVLKLIWMELPETDFFTARIRMLVDHEVAPGDYTFNFRFAYLDGNEKRSVTGPVASIKVLPPTPETLAQIKAEEERSKPQEVLNTEASNNLNQVIAESGVGCTMVTERKSETGQLVNIKIQKGAIGGFGKVEVPVCEGLIATNVANEKGVFSFSDNKVKYVWTDMPETPVLNLTFKLLRSPDAAWLSACSIDGEFSYLDKDQSTKCKINVANMNYVSDDIYAKMDAARKVPEPDPATSASESQAKAVNPVPDAAAAAPPESTGTAVPANAQVQAANDHPLPSNAKTATAGEKTSGTETAANVLKETADKTAAEGEKTGDQKAADAAKEEELRIKAAEAAAREREAEMKIAAEKESAKSQGETSNNDNIAVNRSKENQVSGNDEKENTEDGKRDRSSMKNRKGDAAVNFKVQVCATHRDVPASTIQSVYKLQDEVMQEMHEGWFKFTVGGFSDYSEARNKREELTPFNLPGPFVTAYNAGTRITVQEALMITRQTWVK